MRQRLYTFGRPAHPILQVLYFLVGAVLLIGALLMGAVILSLAIGVAAILGLVVFVRVWWLNRKLDKQGRSKRGKDDDLIEVEYTVVEERDERGPRS